jgi:polyisoprenoid-binding protein YceI
MKLSVILLVMCTAASPALGQEPGHSGSAGAPSVAGAWRVDSSHSSAGFSVKHMMISTVRGTLGPISGTVEYDGKDVASIRADVSVDVTKIDTGNESRDRDLRGAGFFEIDRYPTATFKSRRVQPVSADEFQLIGDLTMHGVTKEVTLDVEGPTPAVKAKNGALKVGATATTKINRREFGLNYNDLIEAGPVVADDVTVTIDLEIVR